MFPNRNIGRNIYRCGECGATGHNVQRCKLALACGRNYVDANVLIPGDILVARLPFSTTDDFSSVQNFPNKITSTYLDPEDEASAALLLIHYLKPKPSTPPPSQTRSPSTPSMSTSSTNQGGTGSSTTSHSHSPSDSGHPPGSLDDSKHYAENLSQSQSSSVSMTQSTASTRERATNNHPNVRRTLDFSQENIVESVVFGVSAGNSW